MTKDELIDLLQAVKRDVVRDRGQMTELACAIQFAIWHLQGEPSFVERNDRWRAEKNAASVHIDELRPD